MTIIFDGKEFARKKEELLQLQVQDLRSQGISPLLVSITAGDDPASILYSNLKQKAAQRVGIDMEIIKIPSIANSSEISNSIKFLNSDELVTGILIQLPLPEKLKADTQELCNQISSTKDVDGLRDEPIYTPATVKAVLTIIESIKNTIELPNQKIKTLIVGSNGMVGRNILKFINDPLLDSTGVDIDEAKLSEKTKNADLIISATGVKGLIKGDMIKGGTFCIDVGSPNADFEFESVSKVARFITPVPGGVGPLTILSLLDNVVIAAGGVGVLQDLQKYDKIMA